MRGWQGGEDGTKVIIFEVDMPHCEENACAWNRPAVWALNAMVSRKTSAFVQIPGQHLVAL